MTYNAGRWFVAALTTHRSMLETGTQLGPYTITGKLGAGGRGEVYRAIDTRSGDPVAVKVLPDRHAGDTTARGRFKREVHALMALSHPNILRIFDFHTADGVSFAAMELLEGETLRDRILRGPIPWVRAVSLGIAIAEGLAATHEKGIIHRDLKPDNIFIEQDGTPKILDFGMARLEMASADESDSSPVKTGPGVMLGTVPYMSPEQVCGLPVDWRSDLFSFGCVMYDMLTATVIFSRKQLVTSMSAILKDPPPSLASFGVEAPPELEAIMQRAVHKDREQRYQSAIDIAEDLRKL